MRFVDLHAQHEVLRPEIDRAIAEVIDSSAFIRGAAIDEFEDRFAQLLGAEHCISCANGTDAIYVALRALGLQAGDEVITTAHSWIATSASITRAGGKVVFCDTEEDYFCIDPAKLESLITTRTRGIIPVHLYGQVADMDAILALAREYGLWVLEDSAQAVLAEYKGRKAGTLGDVGTFSFYPGKNLGAMGDAGCLVTDRDDISEFATLYARHGGKNVHVLEGINSRMDTLQAAILNVKMTRLQDWNQRRRELAAEYDKRLAEIPGVITPRMRPSCSHVYHLYVVKCQRRQELQAALKAAGIPTGIHYQRALPFYDAYAYLGHEPSEFPVAFRHASEVLALPMHPFLERSDVQRVAEAVRHHSCGRLTGS